MSAKQIVNQIVVAWKVEYIEIKSDELIEVHRVTHLLIAIEHIVIRCRSKFEVLGLYVGVDSVVIGEIVCEVVVSHMIIQPNGRISRAEVEHRIRYNKIGSGVGWTCVDTSCIVPHGHAVCMVVIDEKFSRRVLEIDNNSSRFLGLALLNLGWLARLATIRRVQDGMLALLLLGQSPEVSLDFSRLIRPIGCDDLGCTGLALIDWQWKIWTYTAH